MWRSIAQATKGQPFSALLPHHEALEQVPAGLSVWNGTDGGAPHEWIAVVLQPPSSASSFPSPYFLSNLHAAARRGVVLALSPTANLTKHRGEISACASTRCVGSLVCALTFLGYTPATPDSRAQHPLLVMHRRPPAATDRADCSEGSQLGGAFDLSTPLVATASVCHFARVLRHELPPLT